MKIEEITPETLREAFRTLRRQAGLTQAELSRRTEKFQPPMKRLTPNQVCAFERGGSIPSLMSFFSFLVACSADWETLAELCSTVREVELDGRRDGGRKTTAR